MTEEPEFSFYDLHLTQIVERDGRLYEEGITPPVCDFCNDTRVKWAYDCETFVVGNHGSDSGWLACDRCAVLIELGDREGVLTRVLMGWRLRGMPESPMMEQDLRTYQAAFFAHRGERGPFG